MTRAETIATATAALRAMARGLARAVAYLVPLLVAALGYIAKVCADAVSAVRALLLRRARAKSPHRSTEYDQQEAALREASAGRWIAWRALPAQRRFAVRVAAVVLVVVLAVLVRARFVAPVRPEETARSASAETPAAPDDVPQQQPEGPPPVDFGAAAARFGAARQRLGPGEWAGFSEAHVLERGARGTWDDYGVGSPIVMMETAAAGREPRYRMWYVGCHLALREHSCGVGHARSSDGVVWEKAPQPVFMPADSVAQDNLTEIAVLQIGDRYSLWYSVAADYAAGRRRATVNLATSPDGLVWTDQGQVLEGDSPLHLNIEHSVFHDGQRFHMWYVAVSEEHRAAPELRHLSSADGKSWTVLGGTPLESLQRDMEEIGRLTVETTDGRGFRAWFTLPADDQKYRSKALAALISPDGTTWQMQPLDAEPFKDTIERTGVRLSAVAGVNGPEGLWLWVTLNDGYQDGYRHDQCIGVAFRNGRPR
jgi:hypothetical protein